MAAADLTPLPPALLAALAGRDEVLVTSRERVDEGSVPVWFVMAPPGVLYLYGQSFAIKARRWQRDPWVRVRVPGTGIIAEGTATFVGRGPELDAIAPAIVARWGGWGATTLEGLMRTLDDRTNVVVRVEGVAAAP